MPAYVGSLEADLQAASEYSTGGIGPLFKEERREEAFALPEFLTRSAAALRKLGIVNAVTLFVDDEEIYTAPDDATGDTLQPALDAASSAEIDDSAGFYLMLSYRDDTFTHVISVEGSVDHPADVAALVVLVVATPLDEDAAAIDQEDEEDEEDIADDAEPIAPVTDDLPEVSEEGMDLLDAIEAFLARIQAEFDKELALAEPEVDVWIDWENAYAGIGYSSTLPIIPEL
jgi:hypothetical protein